MVRQTSTGNFPKYVLGAVFHLSFSYGIVSAMNEEFTAGGTPIMSASDVSESQTSESPHRKITRSRSIMRRDRHVRKEPLEDTEAEEAKSTAAEIGSAGEAVAGKDAEETLGQSDIQMTDGGGLSDDDLEAISDDDLEEMLADYDFQDIAVKEGSVGSQEGGALVKSQELSATEEGSGAMLQTTSEAKQKFWFIILAVILIANERRRRIPCRMTAWYAYYPCSVTCGMGKKSRNRGVATAWSAYRSKCSSITQETANCFSRYCQQDCVLSTWSSWSGCPVTCGPGMRYSNRHVAAVNRYGGTPCCTDIPIAHGTNGCAAASQVPVRLEHQCSVIPCQVQCNYENWVAWTPCSLTCGVGMSERSRSKSHSAENGGRDCQGTYTETKQCHLVPCPVDCVMMSWEPWTDCSASCATPDLTGTRTRVRELVMPQQHGGRECEHGEEKESCNQFECVAEEEESAADKLKGLAR